MPGDDDVEDDEFVDQRFTRPGPCPPVECPPVQTVTFGDPALVPVEPLPQSEADKVLSSLLANMGRSLAGRPMKSAGQMPKARNASKVERRVEAARRLALYHDMFPPEPVDPVSVAKVLGHKPRPRKGKR